MEARMEETSMSDHKQIRLQVRFQKDLDDVNIDDLPTKITQSDIRKEATSERTIAKIRSMRGSIL